MKKLGWSAGILLALCLSGIGFFRSDPLPKPAGVMATSLNLPTVLEKQRGVSWVAGHEIGPQHLVPLISSSVNWIVQTPFGWQEKHNSPEVRLVTSGHVLWGETDEGLGKTTGLAHQKGIKTLLKPHIWLTRPQEGKWRSDIAMDNEADWQRWFGSYERFMLHYAELASKTQMDGLCIGTELQGTVKTREADWRRLIASIRKIYSGKLTYAANWYEEYEQVPFWDALDFIGIQAYFPLSELASPDLESLKKGWDPHLSRIEQVSGRFGKPVIFTEIGYRSQLNAAAEPWVWPKNGVAASPEDLEVQARCYEAFFQTCWQKPWLAGAFFWKWFPMTEDQQQELRVNQTFTPQFKPAGQVLKQWYSKEP